MLLTFVIVVVAFHLSELAFMFRFHRDRLSWESTLLTPAYVAMLGLALGEYWFEKRFAPWLKIDAVAWIGVALVVVGELVRKVGMLTAARAFTHTMAEVKRDEHGLVTHGIYRWVRHPGYLGWFFWAIGAQLVLVLHVLLHKRNQFAPRYALARQLQQRVADENCHRLAKLHVDRRLAAAFLLIIEVRKIVVNQRRRVDKLHGAGSA